MSEPDRAAVVVRTPDPKVPAPKGPVEVKQTLTTSSGRSGSLIALSTCGVVVIGGGAGLLLLTGSDRFGSLLGRFFGFFFGFGH